MHHEKIASTFLKKCREDKRQKVEKCLAEKTKKGKDKKILFNIKGKLRRHFFKKCREDFLSFNTRLLTKSGRIKNPS